MTKRFEIILCSLLFVIVCLFLYDSFSSDSSKKSIPEEKINIARGEFKDAPHSPSPFPSHRRPVQEVKRNADTPAALEHPPVPVWDKFSTHLYATIFLKSDFKDSVEGQAMALILITNGYPIEYIPSLVGQNRVIDSIKTQEKETTDPEKRKSLQVVQQLIKDEFIRGADGFPPISDPVIVDELLNLCPKKPYKFPYPMPISRDTPDEKILKESDILAYIQEHPAKAVEN